MGLVFGKITVETPKYDVLKRTTDYEIRRYAPSVIAQVTYDPSEFKNKKDGGFMILANYIGALGNPQNVKPEKIAMTAPVITKEEAGEKIAMTPPVITREEAGEKIAMTPPVITREEAKEAEKIAMTAPVITKEEAGEKIAMTPPVIIREEAKEAEKIEMTAPVVTKEKGKLVTMQFVLPDKYKKAEEAPRPVDERVEIREEGERVYGVVRFSGVATEQVVEEKVRKLKEQLEKDGVKVVGEHLLGRYNPPWTIPAFRTNEVMIPFV